MNVYDIVTERILEQLEKGVVPWHRPWNGGAPANFTTKKEYRGVNLILLGAAEYRCPYWLTYNQARAAGGQVRGGEHGTPVVFWKAWREKTGEKDEKGKEVEETRRVLRYYTVFNVEQCDGIAWEPQKPVDFSPIAEAEKIAAAYKDAPPVSFGGDRAYYRPADDSIRMPEKVSFEGEEEYYSTLFHEMAHSTGHEKRLNRKGIIELNGFGSHEYSREELVAEFAAAFLCGVAHIEQKTLTNSAAYIASWSKRLQGDKRLAVIAAAQAQKAADWVRGKKAAAEEASEGSE